MEAEDMAVLSNNQPFPDDPLLPWLSSIKKALDESNSNPSARRDLDCLLENCISKFKDDDRYRNDIRFLKIWILYADSIQDFEKVFRTMEEKNISLSHSVLYIAYAMYLEVKGKLVEADGVYKMGISRNAQPIAELKGFYSEFLERLSEIENSCELAMVHSKKRNRLLQARLSSLVYVKYNLQLETRARKKEKKGDNYDPICLSDMESDDEWITPCDDEPSNKDPTWLDVHEYFKVVDDGVKDVGGAGDLKKGRKVSNNESAELGKNCVDPWSTSIIDDLLRKRNQKMSKYKEYHVSTKAYSGQVSLSSLQKSSKNKIIKLGPNKYHIQGCLGQGGFAQVFKAYVNSNPEDVVALKIQTPAFPWEFYIYRQLDERIAGEKRSSFAFAHRVHLYSDYSILVCDYLSHGTLLDAINSYRVTGKSMEEVLCIYYSIEMLHMLETLHSVGIIHGDFKPDNLLIRYSRDDLTEDGFCGRTGSWRDQGLWLIDWGRGIDLTLFPEGTQFTGDCRTDCFRCLEMQERRPWKFQVDTYGLCVIVYLMLLGSYEMSTIIKEVSSDGKDLYQPMLALSKRKWNVDLWRNLFTKLLNANPADDHISLLRSLRKSFEDYVSSDPQLIKKLTELLRAQRAKLCSG